MPVSSFNNDENILKSWSFYNDYHNYYYGELIDLAQDVYSIVSNLIMTIPTPSDCLEMYSIAIYHSTIFSDMVKRKHHLSPYFYKQMAEILASYILHNDWPQIGHAKRKTP